MLHCVEYISLWEKVPFCKFKYTVLSKGYKESQFYEFTVVVANEPYTSQLYWQKSTWFLLYFRLLWYHSIKQTKFENKTVKSTQPSLVLIDLHDFLIFSNRTAYAWSVEAGNICSVSVFFVRVESQISPRWAKKDSKPPPLGEQDQSHALPQGQQRQSNPHPRPSPPPPPPALHW